MPDADQLKAYLAGRDVPCPACGYNLRGVTTSACPECSAALTLELKGVHERINRATGFALLAVPISLACVGLATVGYWVYYLIRFGFTVMNLAMWIWLGTAAVCSMLWLSAAWLIRKKRSHKPIRLLAWATIAYAVLYAASFVVGALTYW